MPSTENYLQFILEQLSLAKDVGHRTMMGEYVLYCRGKVVGGIYDNRFLVKPTPAAQSMMPDAPQVVPYPGAKPMLMVDNVDNRDFLRDLIEAIADQLPEKKK